MSTPKTDLTYYDPAKVEALGVRSIVGAVVVLSDLGCQMLEVRVVCCDLRCRDLRSIIWEHVALDQCGKPDASVAVERLYYETVSLARPCLSYTFSAGFQSVNFGACVNVKDLKEFCLC